MIYKYKNKKFEGPDQIELYDGEMADVLKRLSVEDQKILWLSSRYNNIPLHEHLCGGEYGNENIIKAYIESFKDHNINIEDYGKEIK